MAEILETAMLVCFGFSWPMNLIKNIKAQTAKSMSLKFILLIIFGYICGITAKIINHRFNYVLVVYLINLVIVSLNLIVYYINTKKDKARLTEETEA
jgi:glucan phosphoethanolaminetransferase (alkaline phosphatase superfamily)